ncbi:DUF892 family protein [Mucilaginibacter panaciglaebae]
MRSNNKSADGHLPYKVFVHNLNRLYFAKRYLDQKMPDLIEKASFNALQLGMHEFWEDLKKQIIRMEEIFETIGEQPSDKNCNPIKAIVKDEFCLSEKKDLAILNDMDLIMYVQVLENINITTYGLLKMVAHRLNYNHIEQLMMECFDESVDNDELFELIANEHIK